MTRGLWVSASMILGHGLSGPALTWGKVKAFLHNNDKLCTPSQTPSQKATVLIMQGLLILLCASLAMEHFSLVLHHTQL